MFTFTATIDGVETVFSTDEEPRVTEGLVGQGQTIPLLNGGAFLAFQYSEAAGVKSVRGARCVVFEWDDLAPVALRALLIACWEQALPVTCTWTIAGDTSTDTLTGYLPAHVPPEIEPTGGACLRIRFTLQAAAIT